jgi:hypothetical protein
MASVPSTLPAHLQLQSPLICLPTEIKHMIFSYCFASDDPILDPSVRWARPDSDITTKMGVGVLRTCQRIYRETDRRPLFAQNTFRFTTVQNVQSFFQCIGKEHGACIQDMEVDARRLHIQRPDIGRDWLNALASDGINGCSLSACAPGLKCLRLNFESWPLIPMFRAELWNLLRYMLAHASGLERIVVVGASKGKGMAKREPWSPVHFVGGDDVGSDDLVSRMWTALKISDDVDKLIKWERRGGKLYLEVVSTAYLVKHVDSKWAGPCTRENCTDPWPENGSCTWFAYLNRNSQITEPTTKGINPSAAG